MCWSLGPSPSHMENGEQLSPSAASWAPCAVDRSVVVGRAGPSNPNPSWAASRLHWENPQAPLREQAAWKFQEALCPAPPTWGGHSWVLGLSVGDVVPCC